MILLRGSARAHTVDVAWVSELATRRILLLSCLVTALLVVLPVDGSAGSVTVLSTALALALSSGLLARAPRPGRLTFRVEVSPDAPARDEKCRRGSFRRQTHPGAPGRMLPRAPQPA
jgi:hypothetical protein